MLKSQDLLGKNLDTCALKGYPGDAHMLDLGGVLSTWGIITIIHKPGQDGGRTKLSKALDK